MRLFMSYLATHPEKLDPVKKQQWAKLARLDAQDMDTVCNLAYLNVAVMKQPGSQVGTMAGRRAHQGQGIGGVVELCAEALSSFQGCTRAAAVGI
jgi:hypothetical protein